MELLNEILTPLFIKLFINSIYASILFFIIFIIRIFFIKKINITVLYFLWTILIIRLILPVDFHIFSFLNFNKVPDLKFNVYRLYTEEISSTGNTGISLLQFSFLNILTIIWLFLITFFIIKRVIVLFSFLKKIKKENVINDKKTISTLNTCVKKLKIKNKIKIIETNHVKSPCIFGIFKYIMLFPSGLLESLNQNEKKCIFFHELSHIKNNDTIIEIITYALRTIYFFNPIITYAFNQMNKDSEYLCDVKSISLLNNDFYSYGNTLIKIIGTIKFFKTYQRIPGIISLLAASNNKKHIKRRFNMICSNSKKSLIITILSIIILLSALGFTFTNLTFAETKNNKIKAIFIRPIDSDKITAKFGKGLDPITKKERFHSGIDLAKNTGDPVKVSMNGTVIKTDEDPDNETGYGKYIIVQHENGYTTLYAKLSEISVKESKSLKANDIIGRVGSTGKSTGPHLHFEIRKDGIPLNPEDYINF